MTEQLELKIDAPTLDLPPASDGKREEDTTPQLDFSSDTDKKN